MFLLLSVACVNRCCKLLSHFASCFYDPEEIICAHNLARRLAHTLSKGFIRKTMDSLRIEALPLAVKERRKRKFST